MFYYLHINYDSWIPHTQKTENQNAVQDKQTILTPFIELTN